MHVDTNISRARRKSPFKNKNSKIAITEQHPRSPWKGLVLADADATASMITDHAGNIHVLSYATYLVSLSL